MQSLQANTLDELKGHIAAFSDDVLFRGQINNYCAPDGLPNLNTSFQRQGCIPPLMFKWNFYATELLRRGGFDIARPDAYHFTHGLLQHYGWRSFFVDLTASAPIAAWFASHRFSSATGLDLCEDSFEEAVNPAR
jgi:hypothetical protein